jgi:hypothetical protein
MRTASAVMPGGVATSVGRLRVDGHPTRAADDVLALGLVVQVEVDPAAQRVGGQGRDAHGAVLLADGEEGLEGPVGHVVRLQERQDDRHPDAVVRPERRAVGAHPTVGDEGADGVGQEVVRGLGRLLRHHVQVGLQDDAGARLQAGGRRLAHDHVAGGVDDGLEPEAAAEVGHEGRRPLLVVRRAGDLGQVVEVPPNGGRLQRGPRLGERDALGLRRGGGDDQRRHDEPGGASHPWAAHPSRSISPGRQVLSNQGSSGP